MERLGALLPHVDIVQVRPKPVADELKSGLSADPPAEARASYEWTERVLALVQHFPQLRARLPAERQHIVMEPADLEASVAAWYERWPPSLQGRFRL